MGQPCTFWELQASSGSASSLFLKIWESLLFYESDASTTAACRVGRAKYRDKPTWPLPLRYHSESPSWLFLVSLACSSLHLQAERLFSASSICVLQLPPRLVLASSLTPWLLLPLQFSICILLRFLIVPVLSSFQVRQYICIHFHGYDGFDVRRGSLQSMLFSNLKIKAFFKYVMKHIYMFSFMRLSLLPHKGACVVIMTCNSQMRKQRVGLIMLISYI